MLKIKEEAVIQFTATITRNAELIFSSPTFELENGLIFKRTNRIVNKMIGYKVCFNIHFNGQFIGVLNAIPSDTESINVKNNCVIRFNENIYENDEFQKVLKHLLTDEYPMLEIIKIQDMKFPTGFGKINPLFIRSALYYDDAIIDEVKHYIKIEIISFEMTWNEKRNESNYTPRDMITCFKIANAYGLNFWFENYLDKSICFIH